ncbi:MAG: site-specific integrase [Candidatus Kapaibacterium sp.]|nr:MAG: site-specific integrase [Candidatus Kapabacteria bacterium]
MELLVSIKTPRLIRDRCGVYYFRLIVPLALRATVGKTEFRRSLRTKDSAIARQRALALSVAVETRMNDDIGNFSHLFKPDAKQRIREKITIDLPNGIIQTDTPEEAAQVPAILAGMAAARQAEMVAGISAVLPMAKCGTNLETAKTEFLKQRKLTLKDSTWRKHRGIVEGFIKTIGNMDVAMVGAKAVTGYKTGLIDQGRGARTVNAHLTVLEGFFEYIISHYSVNMVNPAKNLLIADEDNNAEKYEPFTPEELQRIFQPDFYRKKLKLPDFYWCPLIALFTGARAEEIASLDVEQIYPVKGIWIIDILKGKNANAKRRVPLHQALIDLGLVDYRMSLARAGYKKLFPHVQRGTNGYRKNMTRMFGTYLDLPEVNIIDPLKVFHSFRHTVVTALTGKGVNDGLKRAMVGHDIDTRLSSHDDYIHPSALTVPNLHDAISRLDYEGIDFAALKVSQSDFLPLIAKRIAQQAEQRRKKAEKAAKAAAEAKAKAEAKVNATGQS